MLKIGSHVSFKSPNYLIDSVKESIANGANTMMIYLGPPQNSNRVSIDKYQLDLYFEKYKNIILPQDIIVHAPYIVNLANISKSEWSKQFLIEDIGRMNKIGAKYLVLHPGAYLKQDINESIKHLASNIKEIINKTNDVEIILETMAGKGTEIGSSLNQMQVLISLIDEDRVGISLDTCHMWDSGIDIKNDFENNSGQELLKKLKELNLLSKVKVIHLNDSKNNLFSHKDRHENIGKGFIGQKALINFANHPAFDNIPIILETPYVDNKNLYKEEIAMIKKGGN